MSDEYDKDRAEEMIAATDPTANQVSVSKLEALVEEWRGRVVADTSADVQAENRTWVKAANELEELIDSE